MRRLTFRSMPWNDQGGLTFGSQDQQQPRRSRLYSLTSAPTPYCTSTSSFHPPPWGRTSPHYATSFNSTHSYYSPSSSVESRAYQQTMGDPGDNLRAPGDSDNNGGQKNGDKAGGHRCAKETRTRKKVPKATKKKK